MQPSHAALSTPLDTDAGDQLSKKPAGKDVSEVQLYHALLKLVPDEVSSKGNDVREVQECHALLKFVPNEVLIKGNDVREEQSRHAK